jgi:hypothetical protein
MTLYHDDLQHGRIEILGVWEEHWHARAVLARNAERYRVWLRSQGFSRDEAAERAVRFLAANPPAFLRRPPADGGPLVH